MNTLIALLATAVACLIAAVYILYQKNLDLRQRLYDREAWVDPVPLILGDPEDYYEF